MERTSGGAFRREGLVLLAVLGIASGGVGCDAIRGGAVGWGRLGGQGDEGTGTLKAAEGEGATIEIVSPAGESTVPWVEGGAEVVLEVAVEGTALGEGDGGHSYTVWLDGVAVQEGVTGTAAIVSGIPKGRRHLAVTLHDASGAQAAGPGAKDDLHVKVVGPCTTAAECADGLACSSETCKTGSGTCAYGPVPGCCDQDLECEVGGACVDGGCVECLEDSACDDGDACTEDSCGPDHSCVHSAASGCCTTAADCDDGLFCTTDTCDAGTCAYALSPDPLCCDFDSDCALEDPCVTFLCYKNLSKGTQFCRTGPKIPDCCSKLADCQDGNACTQDSCNIVPGVGVAGVCTHAPVSLAGCCKVDWHCDDLDPATVDTCSNGTCVHAHDETFCPLPDAAGPVLNEVMAAPGGLPDAEAEWVELYNPTGETIALHGYALEVGSSSHVVDDPFLLLLPKSYLVLGSVEDKAKMGFLASHAWGSDLSLPDPFDALAADGATLVLRRPDGAVADLVAYGPGWPLADGRSMELRNPYLPNDDPASWRAAGLSAKKQKNTGWKTAAGFLHGSPVTLNRSSYEGLEAPACVVPEGSGPCVVARCGLAGTCEYPTDGSCCAVDQDCDDGNPCTTQSCDTATSSCAAPVPVDGCCLWDGACDDGDPCNVDRCLGFVCRYSEPVGPGCTKLPEPECAAADCDDGDPCTTDACLAAAGVCSHAPTPGCCHAATDCPDPADPCLGPACDASTHTCGSAAVPGCCHADAECDDGDPCTADDCSAGHACHHVPDAAACCLSALDCEDGDPCTAHDCAGGACVPVPGPGCCLLDEDCHDGLPCTFDLCLESGKCKYLLAGGEGCCDGDSDCAAGEACDVTTGTCAPFEAPEPPPEPDVPVEPDSPPAPEPAPEPEDPPIDPPIDPDDCVEIAAVGPAALPATNHSIASLVVSKLGVPKAGCVVEVSLHLGAVPPGDGSWELRSYAAKNGYATLLATAPIQVDPAAAGVQTVPVEPCLEVDGDARLALFNPAGATGLRWSDEPGAGYWYLVVPPTAGVGEQITISSWPSDPGFSATVESPVCMNDAECVDGDGTFTCICPPDFEGVFCEIPISQCLPNPCQNGGKCKDGAGTFTCECGGGYTGPLCETEIDECDPDPCKNGAVCIDLVGGKFCQCAPGFKGSFCEVNLNECAQSSSIGPATLPSFKISEADLIVAGEPAFKDGCVEEVTLRLAKGPDGGGTGWELRVYEMAGNSASFVASTPLPVDPSTLDEQVAVPETCLPIAKGQYVGLYNGWGDLSLAWSGILGTGYWQSEWTPGDFEGGPPVTLSYLPGARPGFRAHLVHPPPCQNAGLCVDGVDSTSCVCKPGFLGDACEVDVDECAPAPCKNGGECIDLANLYMCLCPEGYAGTSCETNVDDCAAKPCQNGGACKDLVAGYECACKPGFEGLQCEIDLDECESSPCWNGGTCIDLPGGFDCDCAPGWTGFVCGFDIDECASKPCSHGFCVDLVDGWACDCAPGWIGTTCSVDADECLEASSVGPDGLPVVDELNADLVLHQAPALASGCAVSVTLRLANKAAGGGAGFELRVYEVADDHGTLVDKRPIAVNGNFAASDQLVAVEPCLPVPAGAFLGLANTAGDVELAHSDIGGPGFWSKTDPPGAVPGGTPDLLVPTPGAAAAFQVDLVHDPPCQNGAACTNKSGSYACSCPTGWKGKNCDVPVP